MNTFQTPVVNLHQTLEKLETLFNILFNLNNDTGIEFNCLDINLNKQLFATNLQYYYEYIDIYRGIYKLFIFIKKHTTLHI